MKEDWRIKHIQAWMEQFEEEDFSERNLTKFSSRLSEEGKVKPKSISEESDKSEKCQDRSKWESVVSTYSSGKQLWVNVCNGEDSNKSKNEGCESMK